MQILAIFGPQDSGFMPLLYGDIWDLHKSEAGGAGTFVFTDDQVFFL